MFLKKLFLKLKLNKFKKEQYFKYKFELFISNETESIEFEYKYFTKNIVEDIVKDIFNNGVEINNWFINGNQIESIKLLESKTTDVYIKNSDYSWYTDLTLEDVNYFNDIYNKLFNSYNLIE